MASVECLLEVVGLINAQGTDTLSAYSMDKVEWLKANVWVIEQEGRGELQGDLKQLKKSLRDVLRALWKQQHLGLKTKSGLRPNSKEYRGFIYKTSPCAKDRS